MSTVPIALIYDRVSDFLQKEGVSLDAQLAECRRTAAGKGWVLGTERSEVKSGRRNDRPHYQDLLREVRVRRAQGQAVVVLVAALDRLGRNMLERVRSWYELKALGAPVYSVREGGELSDLTANILAAIAEDESRRIGERVSGCRAYLASGGWWPGGRISWGYRLRDAFPAERESGSGRRVLDRDEPAWPYVEELFARATVGESIHALARWSGTLPETVRGGRPGTYVGVSFLLRSPTYIARLGGAVPAERVAEVVVRPVCRWPRLLPDEEWLLVQQQIASHFSWPRQASGRYLLSGFLRCAACGHRMTGNRCKGYRDTYRCANLSLGVGETARHCSRSATCEEVDRVVRAEVGALLAEIATGSPRLREALSFYWRQRTAQSGAEQAEDRQRERTLRRRIARAQGRLKRAALELVDGPLSREGYESVRDLATADLEHAESELALLLASRARETPPPLPPLEKVLGSVSEWQRLFVGTDVGRQRDVLKELIARVTAPRVGWRTYAVEIEWTPLGEELRSAMMLLKAA